MLNVEEIINRIDSADEVEIMEFNFDECFYALRELNRATTDLIIEFGQRDGSSKERLLPADMQNSAVIKDAMNVMRWEE